jgi:hypothetical protein
MISNSYCSRLFVWHLSLNLLLLQVSVLFCQKSTFTSSLYVTIPNESIIFSMVADNLSIFSFSCRILRKYACFILLYRKNLHGLVFILSGHVFYPGVEYCCSERYDHDDLAEIIIFR